MADIFPFRAFRYNSQRVKPADVLTQPYDKITPAMAQRYAQNSPYNLIPVEKGEPRPSDSSTDNVYTRAEQTLQRWIAEGVLLQDALPGIYVYSQEYPVPGGSERRTRSGFIALGRVEDYSAGVVFRHERTLTGPKADRMELLRHTRSHTGQLFMLYTDAQRRIDTLLAAAASGAAAVEAPVEAKDEYDVIHRLWPVFDAGIIEGVRQAMAGEKLVIADGHHRYETAVAYRDQRRAAAAKLDLDAPYEKVMMTFFNTRSEGLLILPTHRVISGVTGFDAAAFQRKLSDTFDVQAVPSASRADRARLDAFLRDLASRGATGPAIGMYAAGSFAMFSLKPGADLARQLPDVPEALRRLDVVLLHRLLLERGLGITPAAVAAGQYLSYERDGFAGLAAVDEGKAQACFLLNPIGVETTTEIALSGQVLPQKSTDFFPKLLSGITIYRLD